MDDQPGWSGRVGGIASVPRQAPDELGRQGPAAAGVAAAKQRRRKAAAQCHLRLDLQTFLPRCAIVGTAGEHANLRARELCAGVRAGAMVLFDKADLALRCVFRVTRAKDNLRCRVVRQLQHGRQGEPPPG